MLPLAQAEASVSSTIRGPDYAMLVGYFVLMLAIGVYFYRSMRGMKVYFTGGNKIPWWLSGVSFYMSSFSAYGFVVYSGLCFRFGWVGVTLFWVSVPATIISVMLFAARWRRARIDSPLEFLESRYSATVRQLFVWTGLPVGILDDSLKLIATGSIVHVGMGFDIEISVLVCGTIMVLYTFMGGLWAVTVTDFVQFVILAAAVLVVLPLSIDRVGGVEGLVQHAPEGFFHLFNQQYTVLYVVLLTGMYAIAYSSTHWHLIQKYFCVATDRDAKKVGWLVVVLNVIGPPMILLPAIVAREFLPADILDTEVYPRLCAAILPVGLLGLIMAAMFSATMANLSSHFNVRASVLTSDVYRRLFRPKAGERELVLAGRAMTALVGGMTVVIAFCLAGSSAPRLFKIMVTLFGGAVAPLGIPMLLGLLSRRITTRSATVAVLSGLILSIAMFFALPEEGTLLGLHWERETTIFAASTLAMLAMMFGLSALWPMEDAETERVRRFHERLRAPIGQLPEDLAIDENVKVTSPFRVVGVCVACIGLLMLGVLPFIDERLPRNLNFALAAALLAIGLLMAWRPGQGSRP